MRLLAEGGSERVSTRAVCEAAGVQPPTIYRLFDSMDGLLDAVAREGSSASTSSSPRSPSPRPASARRSRC
ncbi:helix-turn-helix domain-containing protein [Cryptosporangium phraense]